ERLRARGEPVTSPSSTVHASVAEALAAKIRAERTPAPTPPVTLRRRPVPAPKAPVASRPTPATPAAPASGEPPLELLDVRTRYERALAAARARAEQQRRDSPPATVTPVRVEVGMPPDRR